MTAKAEKAAANGSENGEQVRVGLSKNELRRLQHALEALEARIADTEHEMARCIDELQAASETQDFGRIQAASDAYDVAQRELKQLLA